MYGFVSMWYKTADQEAADTRSSTEQPRPLKWAFCDKRSTAILLGDSTAGSGTDASNKCQVLQYSSTGNLGSVLPVNVWVEQHLAPHGQQVTPQLLPQQLLWQLELC